MQYVGKVGDYVYNQWNSLNPATLSGAIDIIVIEHADGSLHCSPWHVRFGKFRIIKPSQKKIDLHVNGKKTDLPMKLGEGGEAFFVFETDATDLSSSLMTSPVISAQSSPEMSPLISGEPSNEPSNYPPSPGGGAGRAEPELLDLNHGSKMSPKDLEERIELTNSPPDSPVKPANSSSDSESLSSVSRLTFEKVKRITQDLNIPSKIDVNGDLLLDMDGYKPSSQKNIDVSDQLVHSIFLKEMHAVLNDAEWLGHDSKDDEAVEARLLKSLIKRDEDGSIRLVYGDAEFSDADGSPLEIPSEQEKVEDPKTGSGVSDSSKTFIKTLRLSSDQLRSLELNYGRNSVEFRSPQSGASVTADLYLWQADVPIVISDIDGTITKSDALGHVLTMFGRDWTHPGVANLFQDISHNGYHILYLTARSVGQADSTRQYLDSICQDGVRLPKGPVILSPDRTMAALRREIILKKPEVFKMACLRDISGLFFEDDSENTPFYAGFGNRITDAISYRSVLIPSHRIFTINPNGEVHMELLELAGYRSSYLHIGELVDQFFPPLRLIGGVTPRWNQNQLHQYICSKDPGSEEADPSLLSPGSPRSITSDEVAARPDERFTDLNFWREPIPDLSDLTDSDDDSKGDVRSAHSKSSPPASPPVSPRISSSKFSPKLSPKEEKAMSVVQEERPISASFTSPLKNFMIRGSNSTAAPKPMKAPLRLESTVAGSQGGIDDSDDDEDDDYTDDDYEDGEDDDDDDEDDEDEDEDEDEEDEEDDDEEDDFDEDEEDVDQEVDEEDLDLDDGLPRTTPSSPSPAQKKFEKFGKTDKLDKLAHSGGEDYRIMTASDMLKGLDI